MIVCIRYNYQVATMALTNDIRASDVGSSALLARDRYNQLFLGLGRRRVWAETARRTFTHLDWGNDGRDSLVDSACSRRWRE